MGIPNAKYEILPSSITEYTAVWMRYIHAMNMMCFQWKADYGNLDRVYDPPSIEHGGGSENGVWHTIAGAERNRCLDQGETTIGQREATAIQTALKRGRGARDASPRVVPNIWGITRGGRCVK